ncbi:MULTISPECIES: BLF1 family deaminating toxin [unclassified Nocardioides]|uniref:BLF1 family deaminating toxin n=1 Tax=unclassified Nocardioides TaxID=2615069 RepID=UPI003014A2F9
MLARLTPSSGATGRRDDHMDGASIRRMMEADEEAAQPAPSPVAGVAAQLRVSMATGGNLGVNLDALRDLSSRPYGVTITMDGNEAVISQNYDEDAMRVGWLPWRSGGTTVFEIDELDTGELFFTAPLSGCKILALPGVVLHVDAPISYDELHRSVAGPAHAALQQWVLEEQPSACLARTDTVWDLRESLSVAPTLYEGGALVGGIKRAGGIDLFYLPAGGAWTPLGIVGRQLRPPPARVVAAAAAEPVGRWRPSRQRRTEGTGSAPADLPPAANDD